MICQQHIKRFMFESAKCLGPHVTAASHSNSTFWCQSTCHHWLHRGKMSHNLQTNPIALTDPNLCFTRHGDECLVCSLDFGRQYFRMQCSSSWIHNLKAIGVILWLYHLIRLCRYYPNFWGQVPSVHLCTRLSPLMTSAAPPVLTTAGIFQALPPDRGRTPLESEACPSQASRDLRHRPSSIDFGMTRQPRQPRQPATALLNGFSSKIASGDHDNSKLQ